MIVRDTARIRTWDRSLRQSDTLPKEPKHLFVLTTKQEYKVYFFIPFQYNISQERKTLLHLSVKIDVAIFAFVLLLLVCTPSAEFISRLFLSLIENALFPILYKFEIVVAGH